MIKREGMHFYINISNMDKVVIDEENRTGKVNHSLHAVDTFFSMIEKYGKDHFSKVFTIEKITGSRLHMYVTDNIVDAFDVVKEVSTFAYYLSKYINTEIVKYKSLVCFQIQVGASFGSFYEFRFSCGELVEDTTIGYAANYAAKLQALSNNSYISIASEIYDELEVDDKKHFLKIEAKEIEKYNQKYYATANLSYLNNKDWSKEFFEAKRYANNLNLGDIIFRGVNKRLDFDNLSKRECKKIEGIPFFADVRGFTAQFEKNDSNLEEMSEKTKGILESMYHTVCGNNGVHVQFQGDREVALFHDYGDYHCYTDAIVAAMKLIDLVKGFQVMIGVGASLGALFASKIGARGEKDNILLGYTVTQADKFENDKAGENQIVINGKIYSKLCVGNSLLASQFSKIENDCYRTTIGFEKMKEIASMNQLCVNTRNNNYNGAWGKKIDVC